MIDFDDLLDGILYLNWVGLDKNEPQKPASLNTEEKELDTSDPNLILFKL